MHLSALLSGPSAYPGGITIHMLLDPDHSFDLDAAFQRWSGKKGGSSSKMCDGGGGATYCGIF
jgi:hypothetical protein